MSSRDVVIYTCDDCGTEAEGYSETIRPAGWDGDEDDTMDLCDECLLVHTCEDCGKVFENELETDGNDYLCEECMGERL